MPFGGRSSGSGAMTTSTNVVVIAALEREIKPLVKGWRRCARSLSPVGPTFELDRVVVTCAGIGQAAARRAAETAVDRYKPTLLISAGLAGALTPALSVGDTLLPATIVNSEDGTRYPVVAGSGVLVTTSQVADPDTKRLLAKQYSAQLVDTEAASVAYVAHRNGIRFLAVKAVSDELDFELPNFSGYIDSNGRFLTARFAVHLATSPRLWRITRRLSANASYAAVKLRSALARVLAEQGLSHTSDAEREMVGDKRTEF